MAEKQLVCANVREMLQQYGGVWITPDFIDTASLVQSLEFDPSLQKLLQIFAYIRVAPAFGA